MVFRNDAGSFNEGLERENAELKERLQKRREEKMGNFWKVLAVVFLFGSFFAVLWLWSFAGRLISSASNTGVLSGFAIYGVILVWFGFVVYRVVRLFVRKNNNQD